jgi:hypothetical protein
MERLRYVTKVFEGDIVSGKEFPDALYICCTSFTIAASKTGLHLYKFSPSLMKSLSYSINWGGSDLRNRKTKIKVGTIGQVRF